MIKAIFWDLGGVLVDVDLGRAEAAWEQQFETPWGAFEEGFFGTGLKEAFDIGDINLVEVVRELSASVEPALSVSVFEDIWSRVVPARPELVALARDLSDRIWTGVISNTDPIHAANIRHQIGDLGRHWVLSYDVRSLKPAPRIFERAIEVVPAPADETLFVDDLEDNVAAARKAGLVAHRFVSRQRLVEQLAELGIRG